MVLILAICLLLFAVFMMIQQEGFDTETCLQKADKNTCINTAGCNWIEPEKKCYSCSQLTKNTCINTAACNWLNSEDKCYSCSELTSCEKCLTTDKCGWCKDSSKCVLTDRNGFPVGKACSNANYVGAAGQCPSAQAKQRTFTPGPPTDMEAEVFNAKLPVLSYTQATGTSCSMDTIVANVKKAVDIKGIVDAELKANGIKLKEGFTQEDNLVMTASAFIKDDIRAMTRKSLCASVLDKTTCTTKPSCKWDGAKCTSK